MFYQRNGNVLVYVLLAVALLAALTYAISRDSGGQQHNQLTTAEVKLLAADLIKHSVSAEMAVQQMTQWGTNLDEIRFDLPGTAGYSSNVTKQIYHPSGGGLLPMQNLNNYTDINWHSSPWLGWSWKNNNNVGWTPSTATDIIYSKGGLSEAICKEINHQLIGTASVILAAPGAQYQPTFLGTYTSSNLNLTTATCPGCNGIKAACIERPIQNPKFRIFYNIIGSR